MNIRRKAVVIVAITLFSLIVILYSVVETIFSDKVSKIEISDMERNIERIESPISNELSRMDNINKEWASLDETSSFISKPDKYYIDKYFADSDFDDYKINFVIFVNKEQKVIYSQGYDFSKFRDLKLSENFLNEVVNNSNMNMIKGSNSGIASLPEGIVFLSSQSIRGSDNNGPIQGKIIIGRFLDSEFTRHIYEDSGFNVIYRQLNYENMDDGFINAKRELEKNNEHIFIHVLDKSNIEGYTLLNDISGKPAIIAKIVVPRHIFIEGQTSKGILFASIILTSLMFCAIILLILEKEVLGPGRQREALINSIPALIYFKDDGLRYITANRAYCEKHNTTESRIKGKTVFEIEDYNEANRLNREELEVISSGIPILNKTEKHIEKDGREVWYSISKVPYYDNHGNVSGMVGVNTDVTETKTMRDKLQYLAYHDQLTGLPNKTYFIKLLENTIKEAKSKGCSVGILFIDLDQFKLINDTLGHVTGDTFLSDVAERFRQCMDGEGIISRFGGDEFAVLVPDVKDKSVLKNLAECMLKLISNPWEYGEQVFYITTSIGIALYPKDGSTSEEILKNADAAMYYAKKHGKDSFMFYNEQLSERAIEKIKLKKELINALTNGEFELYYQPQVNATHGRVMGVEALIRWNKPGAGLIPPDKFIHFAESCGLIIPIGEAVLKMACEQAVKWQEEGLLPIRMAVNVSAKQFENQNFDEIVKRVLEDTGMSADFLEIEITETDMMKYPEQVIAALKILREMGVRISIDDFGTGYSSLMYLKQLPIDRIKIDKSFVQDITEKSGNTAIIRTIIDLSKNMGLDLIAEGVETEEQLEFLRKQKCDEVQGYIYSKPLPALEVKKWLE